MKFCYQNTGAATFNKSGWNLLQTGSQSKDGSNSASVRPQQGVPGVRSQ